jgi:adenine-specific DNA-methyltransferase
MAKRSSNVKTRRGRVASVAGASFSPQKDLVQFLKSLFPEVFAEGKVDPASLKKVLGEDLAENGERYGLSWAGKTDCFRHIQETTTATLKPCRKESVDFDNTENIFIEGDNLEVLKVLQRTYYGKIKMIYIDPPYNTGNDSFIYPDRFKEEKEGYELRAGIKDAEGLLTKDGFWRKNSKDAGHFHSNWLCMMYPRLFLAANLLRRDGVIFASIDNNEVHNLRMIMNEIFGEENFIAMIVWEKGRKNDSSFFSDSVEYMLVYGKDLSDLGILGDWREKKQRVDTVLQQYKDLLAQYRGQHDTVEREMVKWFNSLPRTEPGKKLSHFHRSDDRGLFFGADISSASTSIPDYDILHPKTGKPVKKPSRGWGCTQPVMLSRIREGRVLFGDDETTIPLKKSYLEEVDSIVKTPVIYKDGRAASLVLRDLFGCDLFDNPKDHYILSELLTYASNDNSYLTLDFFAGSCTTAHAVMTLNAEDGGNRKFMCVQLAEPCKEDSKAFKAGFRTVADIGKERIRRAAKKIKKEAQGKLKFDGGKLDLGFKVLKLEQSNFKQWRENIKTPAEFKSHLYEMVDNVAKGAKAEDMLYEIILKNSRFDLNVKLEKKTFDGVDYYSLADGVEIICLASKVTRKFVDKVLAEKPEKFTCLDAAFKDNDQLKTNTALQMESAKIEFKVI